MKKRVFVIRGKTMRMIKNLLTSLILILTCVLVGVIVAQNVNIDGILSEISQVAGEAQSAVSSEISLVDPGTSSSSGNPAIPVAPKITSAPESDVSQASVSKPVAAATLDSVWGETGMKGLTVYEYGKSLLNKTERESYCNIADAVQNVEPQVRIETTLTPTEIKKVYEYYIYDHSEVFYISGVKLSYYQGGSSYVYRVSFEYKYGGDKNKIESMRGQIRSKALEMLGTVNGLSTDLKKEKALHDLLIKQCSYDLDAAKNPAAYPDSFTVYGALINHMAVCQGYAQSMKLLLTSAGIKCLYVTGQANGGGHAWNMVEIGGQWRYLDATFDDPVYYNSKGQYTSYSTVSYTYFNYINKSDRTVGTFDSANPFSGSSENYEKMPKVS